MARAPRGGGWKVGCEKRSRVESRQPNFATLASRYFDVSRHGSRSPRRFFFKTSQVSVVPNDSQKRREISKKFTFFPRMHVALPSSFFFPRRLSWRRHRFRLLNGSIWTRNLARYFWQDRRSIVK